MSAFPFPNPTVTIADGASLSGAAYIGYGRIVGLITPSGWDAADITLQASVDGVAYVNVYEPASDTEYTIQAGASRHIALPVPILGAQWIKVRSGTAGSAVNQSGAVDVIVVVEKYPAQGQ